MKDKLLAALMANTINGDLDWTLSKSVFNSEIEYHLGCTLNDGSLVTITIQLEDKQKFKKSDIIAIANPNLVSGRLYLHSLENPIVNDIGRIIYNRNIRPNLIPKKQTQDEVISSIIDSIPSKSEIRDRKISSLIQEEKEDKKSTLRKLLGL